jgi:hypothetical protein
MILRMDNRSLATDRSPLEKGADGSGLSRARQSGFALPTAYAVSDRIAVESLIGLPWNR